MGAKEIEMNKIIAEVHGHGAALYEVDISAVHPTDTGSWVVSAVPIQAALLKPYFCIGAGAGVSVHYFASNKQSLLSIISRGEETAKRIIA